MNTKETLKKIANQLTMCFYNGENDKLLGVRILIFLFTGLAVLWFFIAECLYIFLMAMVQSVGAEYEKFIKDEERSALVRVAFMCLGYPLYMINFIYPAFMIIGVWLIDFIFNCFAFITSLGKSGWKTIIYYK
ncbi:MAG: hypothetical protein IKM01_04795 [Clostridia bacterium]|nr:hypothetical protein [Clostridia bacterium]MBR6751545.1 hypothetical protein [Clostridia bacterium]